MLGFVGLAFFWKLASGTARNSSFMKAIINVRILVNPFLILDYVLKSWEVLLMFHLIKSWWHLLVIVNLHNNSTKTTNYVNFVCVCINTLPCVHVHLCMMYMHTFQPSSKTKPCNIMLERTQSQINPM